jgi:hypothetical protein
MNGKSLLAGLCALGLLAGCSVTPKQVYELRQFLPSAEKREAERLAAMAWRLSFAGAEYLVWPAPTAEGGLVFVGAGGLRILFDGREITRIEGLPGAFGPVIVEKRGKDRDFRRGGRRSYSVRCNEPTEWQVRPERAGWRMECRGELNGVRVQTQHTVEWGSGGEPVRILSTVAPGSRPLSLTKTNP